MILKDLAVTIHQNAIDKGFYNDRTQSELDRESLQALTISELSEALEDVRKGGIWMTVVKTYYAVEHNGYDYIAKQKVIPYDEFSFHCANPAKPEGLPSEISDAVIRALDYMQFFGIAILEPLRAHYRHDTKPKYLAAAIQRMNRDVCDDDHNSMVQRCYNFAYSVGFDLDNAILCKHQYNLTRQPMHGGKTL